VSTSTLAEISFNKYTEPQELEIIINAYILNSEIRGKDGVHPSSLLNSISSLTNNLSRRMRSGNYRFTTYREQLKSKGVARNPRVLSIPTAQDRIVLKSVGKILHEIFPHSRGRRPQPIIEKFTNDLTSAQYDSYIRIDIEDFYPTLNHTILANILAIEVPKELLKIIISAIQNNTTSDFSKRSRVRSNLGVPQGLSISNLLAEIYMRDLDKEMIGLPGIAYYRYVDDIIILCNSNTLATTQKMILTKLRILQLKTHPINALKSKSCTGKTTDSIEYLGYQFSGEQVSVRKSSVSALEIRVLSIFTQFAKATSDVLLDKPLRDYLENQCLHKLNLRITGCTYEETDYGWVRYFAQMNDLTLLKQQDALVKQLMKRFGVSKKFVPKTFLRTYWEINKPRQNSNYIPNFGNYSVSDMKEFLGVMTNFSIYSMTDEEVKGIFRNEIRKVIRDLNEDVRSVS